MARVKHNWTEIRAAYMKSDAIDVAPFVMQNYWIDVSGWNSHANTKWWRDEKLSMLDRAKAKAMEETEKKMVEAYKPTMEELWEMHKGINLLFKASIKKAIKDSIDPKTWEILVSPNIFELEKLWKIVKTEKGEPTSNIKQDTKITGVLEVKDISQMTDEEVNDYIKNKLKTQG